MIQLASDPTARRVDWRSAAAEDKGISLEARKPRQGHAWPFISRYAGKPAAHDAPHKPASAEHGS